MEPKRQAKDAFIRHSQARSHALQGGITTALLAAATIIAIQVPNSGNTASKLATIGWGLLLLSILSGIAAGARKAQEARITASIARRKYSLELLAAKKDPSHMDVGKTSQDLICEIKAARAQVSQWSQELWHIYSFQQILLVVGIGTLIYDAVWEGKLNIAIVIGVAGITGLAILLFTAGQKAQKLSR